jgi:hypothetical protein
VVPRSLEASRPQAPPGKTSGALMRHVAARVAPVGERPARTHHPGAQVRPRDKATADRPPVAAPR